MKLPVTVTVTDNGDVDVFATVEEAEASMEPIDVKNGEFVVTDADGQRLDVRVVIEKVRLFFGFLKVPLEKTKIIDLNTNPTHSYHKNQTQ